MTPVKPGTCAGEMLSFYVFFFCRHCSAYKLSSAVMNARDLHTFITNYRAEDVGKSAETGSETLLTCDIVAHSSVEQI